MTHRPPTANKENDGDIMENVATLIDRISLAREKSSVGHGRAPQKAYRIPSVGDSSSRRYTINSHRGKLEN